MVAYAYDELFLAHQPRSAHPERPARALAVMEALGAAGLAARGRAVPVRPASDDEILRVHTPEYLALLARTLPGASGQLDADTYFSPRSWDAARAAAGAAVDLALAAVQGD